jgi:hypothetical protein
MAPGAIVDQALGTLERARLEVPPVARGVALGAGAGMSENAPSTSVAALSDPQSAWDIPRLVRHGALRGESACPSTDRPSNQHLQWTTY